MGEALEILQEIIENGFTIVTVIAILNILLNWFESRRKRRAYERMETKIDHIMRKEGITWNGPQTESQKAQTNSNVWYLLCLAAISRVEYLLRRGRQMQISKTWLASVIAYFAGQIALKYGVTFKAEWADMIADFIINFGLPIAMALLSPLLNRIGGRKSESKYFAESNK